jgi:ketosteroid isomerase-like protein
LTNTPVRREDRAVGTFDFAAYSRAFVEKDLEPWLGFYADDAEWIEYKPTAPPSAPVRMSGKAAIRAFLDGVAASDIGLALSDAVVGDDRVAFCVTCDLGGGRRVIENVILTIRDGRIVRQVDVEAWD